MTCPRLWSSPWRTPSSTLARCPCASSPRPLSLHNGYTRDADTPARGGTQLSRGQPPPVRALQALIATTRPGLVPIQSHPISASTHPIVFFLLVLLSPPPSWSWPSSSSYAFSSHQWSRPHNAAPGTWPVAHLCPHERGHKRDHQSRQRSPKSDPG